MNAVMEGLKKLRWDEAGANGNKFMQKLDVFMLVNDGYAVKRHIKHSFQREREWVEVVYDRKYVIAYLVNEVVKVFYSLPFIEFIKLIIEAWNYAHNHSDNSQQETAKLLDCLLSGNDNSVVNRGIDDAATNNQVSVINISLKVKKLHGKDVYQVDDLTQALQQYGIEVINDNATKTQVQC